MQKLAWLGAALMLAAAAPPVEALTQAPAHAVATLSARVQKRELDIAEALVKKKLEALPEGSQVVVQRDPQELTLRIPVEQLFGPDSAQLKPHSIDSPPLAAVTELMRKRHRLLAQINVYTDSIGGPIANHGLSEQRALALLTAMHAASIRPARISGAGLGASSELVPNDTPEGREQNRRVEVVFALTRSVLAPANPPPRAWSGSEGGA
jgi:outer membrane protein OmpA-like peptidoglycan-associated protein